MERSDEYFVIKISRSGGPFEYFKGFFYDTEFPEDKNISLAFNIFDLRIVQYPFMKDAKKDITKIKKIKKYKDDNLVFQICKIRTQLKIEETVI